MNEGKDLAEACTQGYLETVKFLVKKGGDVIAQNNLALREASQEGHFELVKYLVEKGGNIKVCTKKNQQLLFQYKIWKKWRRFLLRRWATRLLKIFYSPDFVGGNQDKINFRKELQSILE